MNDSVLIKTKMVTIGTDIHLLVHATACADFDNKFERKTQSTRFHQTSQATVVVLYATAMFLGGFERFSAIFHEC